MSIKVILPGTRFSRSETHVMESNRSYLDRMAAEGKWPDRHGVEHVIREMPDKHFYAIFTSLLKRRYPNRLMFSKVFMSEANRRRFIREA